MDFIEPLNIRFQGVTALFTTKVAGDHLERIIMKKNISRNDIYLPLQKHTNRIHILAESIEPVVADAVITERRDILIGVQAADCAPILLFDSRRMVVGAVHAGWRGTAKGILKTAIDAMSKRFHSSTVDILVAIGPSIRKCCYEVGDDVTEMVQDVTGEGNYYHKDNGKYFLDLSTANSIQALSMGVLQQNIWQSEECTSCNPDRFYSYRRAKGPTGRQGGVIGMW